MIAAIKSLDRDQQRQLIRLLEPRVDLTDIPDDALLDELVQVLRETLQVPPKDDLPEYLRRRLIDVAKRHFQLDENFDTVTDMELARALVDFAFEAAAQLDEDDERRAEFEIFLRTKDRRERTRWLVESQRFASLVRDGTFDETAARRRALELYEGGEAHRETARAILRDLRVVDEPSTATRRRAGISAAGRTSISAALAGAGMAALAPAAAVPLAAVTGSVFMSGRRKRDLVRGAEEDVPKARAQRARSSRLVQGVVSLCTFLIVNAPGADE